MCTIPPAMTKAFVQLNREAKKASSKQVRKPTSTFKYKTAKPTAVKSKPECDPAACLKAVGKKLRKGSTNTRRNNKRRGKVHFFSDKAWSNANVTNSVPPKKPTPTPQKGCTMEDVFKAFMDTSSSGSSSSGSALQETLKYTLEKSP